MTAASVRGMTATGERAGLPVRRVLSDPAGGVRTSRLCYVSRGFSLHAARRIESNDRAGLEQLCSYVTRPPLAAGSLEKVADDKYLFKLKPPWSDGHILHHSVRTRIVRKARRDRAPPPRAHTTRYHGLLAPHSKREPRSYRPRTTGTPLRRKGRNPARPNID